MITVIGTITYDVVIYPDMRKFESLGGILYNIIALANLTDETIIPVANVGKSMYTQLTAMLSKYHNIKLNGLNIIKQRHPVSFLFMFSEYGTQYDEGQISPILFKQVKPFLNSSFILANFTSGYDINLRTLKMIRKEATCPIYLDYHCLSLGRDKLGNRYLKRVTNWNKWVSLANFVQFNKIEAQVISGKEIRTKEDALSFGKTILKEGPKTVIITLGREGSFIIYLDKKNKVKHEHIPSVNVPYVISTVGCGDFYSAGFLHYYLKYHNNLTAARLASQVASKRCTMKNINEF